MSKKINKESKKIVQDSVKKELSKNKGKLDEAVEEHNAAMIENQDKIEKMKDECFDKIEEESESIIQKLVDKLGKEDINVSICKPSVFKIGKTYVFRLIADSKVSITVVGKLHLYDDNFLFLKDVHPSLEYSIINKSKIVYASIK